MTRPDKGGSIGRVQAEAPKAGNPLAAGALFGGYEILGHLASGGMGEVYLARRRRLGGFERIVVLKVMLPHLARDERCSRMFIDEARIASGLLHPNIVQVNDFDRAEDTFYLAMEYLQGQSVAACLRHAAAKGAFVPADVTARILCDAATGLAYAHEAKGPSGESLELIHRDISPENLFVTYAGPTKLLDFGVARVRGRLTQTQEGEFKGKISYMAPEMVRGERFDQRVDLFSLGVVMFEMLTTRRLFASSNPATVLHRVLNEPIPDLTAIRPDVDPELASLCRGLLERDVDKRVGKAALVADQLERWLSAHNANVKTVGAWISAEFAEAYDLSARIASAVETKGGVDRAAIERARSLTAGVDDTVVREIDTHERYQVASATEPGAVAEPVAAMGGVPVEGEWVARESSGRWVVALVVLLALGFGVYHVGPDKILEPLMASVRSDVLTLGDLIGDEYVITRTLDADARVFLVKARSDGAELLLRLRGPTEPTLLGPAKERLAEAGRALEVARIAGAPEPRSVGVHRGQLFQTYALGPVTPLADLLRRDRLVHKRGRKLVRGLVDAFVAAERTGVAHGAVDPSAVFVRDTDGEVVVVGFGFGAEGAPAAPYAQHRAPELRPADRAVPPSDQFGLGLLVKEVLRLADDEANVAALLARATAVDHRRRFASLSAFGEALGAVLDPPKAGGAKPNPKPPKGRSPKASGGSPTPEIPTREVPAGTPEIPAREVPARAPEIPAREVPAATPDPPAEAPAPAPEAPPPAVPTSTSG